MKDDDTLHKCQTIKKQDYLPLSDTHCTAAGLIFIVFSTKCIRTYQLRQQEHPYKASAKKRAFQLPLK